MPISQTIPLYELTIDGTDSFVEKISLVENPAIEENFLAFSKQLKFKLNEDKMELFGPAMIPNQMIFRRDDDGKEYNVFFSADTIKQIESTYFKKGFQGNINIEHGNNSADSYVFESFIIDKQEGIAPNNFNELPDGTWMVKVKVQNEKVWKEIKEGKRKGFSVEGIFTMIKSSSFNINKSDEEELLEDILYINSLLEQINL